VVSMTWRHNDSWWRNICRQTSSRPLSRCADWLFINRPPAAKFHPASIHTRSTCEWLHHFSCSQLNVLTFYRHFSPLDYTYTAVMTDRVRREGKAIGRVRLSVCLFVSTPSFEPSDLFDLSFYLWVSHDHSSPGIESQGHTSRSKINVQRLWA